MRKLLQSLVALCFTSFSLFALAGGPVPVEPAPAPAEYAGVYVDLSAGYAFVDWGNFRNGAFNGYTNTFAGAVNSNQDGGFTYGFDVGYRINKFLGIEGGWYRLPTVRGNSNVFISLPDLKVSSWFGYLAFKVIAPISKQFELFMKAGAGYRRMNYDGNAPGLAAFGDNQTNYVSGVFGAGLQYWIDENWSVSVQDLAMLKHNSGGNITRRAPTANLVLASVGYIFGVM